MVTKTIENEKIRVSINMHGGCLASILDKENNEELLYQPDTRAWSGQDIFIFPFIARLKDKTYSLNDKTYSLDNHGLARYNDFYLISEKEDEIIIGFDSDKETRKKYPFSFHTAIKYKVEGKELSVTYLVQNLGSKTMYFGFGAHPALKVDYVELDNCLDTSKNYIEFEEETYFDRYELDETGSFVLGKVPYGTVKSIETNKQIIKDYKTLILDAPTIRKVSLRRNSGRVLTYTYDDPIKYIAIWSFPEYGDYICIEPWVSLPDFMDAPKDLSKKESLVHLCRHKEFSFTYRLDIGSK